jgi:hypothetical protein
LGVPVQVASASPATKLTVASTRPDGAGAGSETAVRHDVESEAWQLKTPLTVVALVAVVAV